MVSDFVNANLALTDEEYRQAAKNDLTITQEAHSLLTYGENQEVCWTYWTCENFAAILRLLYKYVRSKYPKSEGGFR